MNTTQLSLIATKVGSAEPSMSDAKIAKGIWVVLEGIERCFGGDLSEKWSLSGTSPKFVQNLNLEVVEVQSLNLKTIQVQTKLIILNLKVVQVKNLNLREVQFLRKFKI
jgi:hypothetical protein